jgi:hypothetical protein
VYSKIDARFWDDEKVLSLSTDARYLMLYLLSTKHRNVLGCYQMPKAYALEDTRLPDKRFSRAWNELISSGMVSYDDDSRTLLVRNFLRYNPIENHNQVKGAIKKLEGLPKSHLFVDVYEHIIELVTTGKKDYLEPLAQSLPKLLPEASVKQLGKPFAKPLPEPMREPDNSKQETDSSISEQEAVTTPLPPASGGEGGDADAPARKAEIARIWDEYDFSPEVEKAVRAWGKYKAERNQRYKPTGLRSLLSQVRNNVENYGEQPVVTAINESMASGYQGITWSSIAKAHGGQPVRPQGAEKPSKNPFINAVMDGGGE